MDFITTLPNDCQAIINIKNMNKEELENQLISMKDYSFLPKLIEKLETQGLGVDKELKILEEAKEKLTDFAKEKLIKSLDKNPDLKKFTENRNYDHRKNILYAPLTTVDVERSFSLYKNILTDRRHRLTESNIEKLNVIYFNSTVFSSN
jgi:hypothetical protein